MTEKASLDLVYLAGCGLRCQPPDPDRVRDMDLEAVFRESCRSSLEALVGTVLQQVPQLFQGDLAQLWSERVDKVLRKTILMDAERQALCRDLENMGCWYLPLKGSVLKDLYPGIGLRQMADSDILFDRQFRSRVTQWFLERGYTAVSLGETNHDVYEKPPVMNFEMHVDLFAEYYNEKWGSYWKTIQDRLLPLEGTRYGREMTDRDFYLYFVAHGFKHYSDGGTGLRTLCDFWVWLQAKEDTLDLPGLAPILQDLGLQEYEQDLRLLAHQVFDRPFDPQALSPRQQQILSYLLGSGTYGSWENEVTNALRQAQEKEGSQGLGQKLKYLWQRLFPGRDFYAQQIDREALLKSPWKRCCFNARRLFTALCSKRRQIGRELGIIFRKK